MKQRYQHQTFVKSLRKGLDILETFSPQKPMLTIREISKETKIPKPTVFRFLRTLVSLGYVSFDKEIKYYYLTPRVISLGYTVLSSIDLRDTALPYMREMSQVTGQNVNLGILEGKDVVYIERIQKWEVLNINIHVGTRVNSCRTAIGRAILAFLNPEKFKVVFNQIIKDHKGKEYVGVNIERLKELLEEVRCKGYATSDQEAYNDIRAIAAPIFGKEGNVEGAINIPVLAHIVKMKELIERYVPYLLKTAETISMARGFVKNPKEKDVVVSGQKKTTSSLSASGRNYRKESINLR